MARGIGTLTVSVQANTAKAIKDLRDFSQETRQTARTAREMQQSFRGNTLADYKARFGGAQQVAELRQYQETIVDLRRDTDRYQESVSNLSKRGFNPLSNMMKITGTVMKGIGFVGATVAAAHLTVELYKNYRGWKSVTEAISEYFGVESAGAKKLRAETAQNERDQAAVLEAATKRGDAKRERAAVLAAARRERMVAEFGEREVQYREDVDKFGSTYATGIWAERDRLQTIEEQKAAAERKEEERRKRAEEHADNLRRDAEAVQKLKERVVDFGKDTLQRERDQLLRTIEDVKQQGEVKQEFRKLEELQARKDAMDDLKKERGTLAGRTGQDSAMLDARTSEGWAALRNSVRSAEIEKLDEQIAVLKMIEGKVGAPPKQEVFTL